MKRTLMTLVSALLLSFGSVAFAADAAAKPDCSTQQKALDDANAAAKATAKPYLSSCADKNSKAAKDKVKDAKKAVDCCKNPKKKGCAA
jgi:hypothetical protein